MVRRIRPFMKTCIFLMTGLLFLFHPLKSFGIEIKDTAFIPESHHKCLLVTDQSQNRIAIVDVESAKIVWQWRADESNVRSGDIGWFKAPSDAKVVYNGKYILMTASLGGVALVRIADKKTIFYTYVGGNTHSAELLPDGNIVTASSTGNFLKIIHTDTAKFPDAVYMEKIYLPQAHNVVWDKRRQVLWSASGDKLYAFQYNFNCTHPDLKKIDSIHLPLDHPHDLFPVYGRDLLWLTTVKEMFKINPATRTVETVKGKYTANIKSVSSGPAGKYPTIIMLPQEKWWTDEVLDIHGNIIFKQRGLRMYKVRWLLPNHFSYPP